MSNSNQAREPCGTDTQITPGYKCNVQGIREGLWRERAERKHRWQEQGGTRRIIRLSKEAYALSLVNRTATAAVNRSTAMNPGTKEKAEGMFHEVKGKVKERAGR